MSKTNRLAVGLGLFFLVVGLVGCHGRRVAGPVATAEPPSPALTDIYLTDDKDNALAKDQFSSDSKPIYVMYSAQHVRNVPIRAVWMADSPQGGTKAVLDEQEVTVASDTQQGTFSERPPMSGWALGPYQVDLYLGATLVHTEHFTVVQQAVSLNPEATDTPGSPASDSMSNPTSLPTSGVLVPNVTPIPETPGPPVMMVLPHDSAVEDAQGRVIIGIHDAYMLHVSQVCTNVVFRVKVNGRLEGVYAVPDVTSDMSLAFKPGPNRIQLSWYAPMPSRDCQMAIQLRRGRRLRTLTQIHVFRLSPPQGSVGLGVVVQ